MIRIDVYVERDISTDLYVIFIYMYIYICIYIYIYLLDSFREVTDMGLRYWKFSLGTYYAKGKLDIFCIHLSD